MKGGGHHSTKGGTTPPRGAPLHQGWQWSYFLSTEGTIPVAVGIKLDPSDQIRKVQVLSMHPLPHAVIICDRAVNRSRFTNTTGKLLKTGNLRIRFLSIKFMDESSTVPIRARDPNHLVQTSTDPFSNR
jgi:hypothetical protein